MNADKDYRDQFEVQSVRTINCFDLDDKVLSPEFPRWKHGDFHALKEASNDTWIEVTVEKGIQDEYERQEVQTYLDTGEDEIGYGLPDCLLSILCERGLIEPGGYIVHVFW